MGNKILFNIASRSRPDKFNKIVKHIQSNVKQRYTILAKVDDNDPEKVNYDLKGCVDVGGVSNSKIHAINRGIPNHGWDIIVDISDDFVFTNKCFSDIISEDCGYDDCVHYIEPFSNSQAEKSKNEQVIIMACMGNYYYNRFGYIYNPEYKSLFCDNELFQVAKKLGKYKLANDLIFYHAHPAAGYGKADAQTQHTESFWKEDKATYYRRKEAGFP